MIKCILHSKESLRRNMWHLCLFFSHLLFHSLRHFRVMGLVQFDLKLLCHPAELFFSPYPSQTQKVSLSGSLCTSFVSFHILYSIFTLLLCRCHKHTASFRQILQVMRLLPAVSLRPGTQKTSEDSAQACDKLSSKFYIVSEKE